MATILVIEDAFSIRELIREFLQLEGFEVEAASNGLEGVAIAQEARPDLIICDVMMPSLDGYGVLKALQQRPETSVIPFIFLTAQGTRQDIRHGMNLGADDYLIKPFSNDELLEAIAIRLKKREASLWQSDQELQLEKEKIEYLLNHDPLTGLPNQLSLQEQFEEILRPIPNLEQGEQCIPLIVMSLDRLQRINSLLGYEGGNQVLQNLAEKLRKIVEEQGIITRLNTNEFVIILGKEMIGKSLEKVKFLTSEFTQNLLQLFGKPLKILGQEIPVSLSLGLAFYPQDGETLDQLLPKAISAKESVKNKGGNFFQFYTPELRPHSLVNVLALELDLRGGLERQEFVVYYQPQICLQGDSEQNILPNSITGAEALIRWQHPVRGLVSPGCFIPLAEETGLIQGIGEWVLTQVGQQINEWKKQKLLPFRVAVNLSARQFQDHNLVSKLKALLERVGMAPTSLELELTESMLVENVASSIEQLQAIKDLGIRISIDDFGTGYSSLGYLQQFPFDILKIDQCFIRNIDQNPKNAAIATAIIEMAHQLNLQVIAEGVETTKELAVVKEKGCDYFQGYLFSPPLPSKDFTKLLINQQ
ncbi:MAG: putative bifunctional diguanylate cyclase/phosphodiesterase [Microcystaceae cyanobacterium]